jgi:hypothetical protein
VTISDPEKEILKKGLISAGAEYVIEDLEELSDFLF